MTTLAPTPDAALANGFNRLRAWADAFVETIGSVPDSHLVEVARNASEMETQAFRVRGACAAELKRRVRERSLGDEAKIGAELLRLALEAGVNFHTLKDDCRIFETFGDECLSTNIYPREVYRLALTAREPERAVEMYVARKEQDARYSTLDYRRDISELNRGRTTPAAAPPGSHRLFFDLSGKAIAALKVICERLHCDDEEAVNRALVHAARSLEHGDDI